MALGCTIFLVRHAQTLWNQEERLQGRAETSLTKAGMDAAFAMAKRVALWNIARCIASPQRRAKHTALLIIGSYGSSLEIMEDARWRERDLGRFEGQKKPLDWCLIPDDQGGQESFHDVFLRAFSALVGLVVDAESACEKNVLVVTHGGVMQALLAHWLSIKETPKKIIVGNLACLALNIHEGQLFLSLGEDITLPLVGGKKKYVLPFP